MIYAEKTELLEYRDVSPGVFGWEAVGHLWAKRERQAKQNLFSRVGIGAVSVLFTLPDVPELTLHNAFRVGDRFYFITAIDRRPVICEVSAAETPVTDCTLFRVTQTLDSSRRPVFSPPEPVYKFTAVVTEKYVGFSQGEPMARTETTYVLVTPKLIVLTESDLVEIGGKKYAVRICHLLDEYKNEYELTRKADV